MTYNNFKYINLKLAMQLSSRPTYTSEKAERLEARLSREQKELIQHAADLLGRSLTDFVINSLQEEAKKIIREHEIITLTARESKNFVNSLLNPPEPNVALNKAVKRYNSFIVDEE
ncbi:Uncharacterized protein conserved in bacteria [Legionella cincinnatiensis]|uniref:Uncharacterized protein conserved in bacteria n=2 Tax=Legionella cincinnatiensis TaxID=28085 RepID=A0A378IHL9_9GAMM|nr:hypothetical protein Lcin_1174 [Legionella cincinnatiensis]STX34523.1 Uncharacterized protein conserved in bacteria [Legionella cincinnatiensis]